MYISRPALALTSFLSFSIYTDARVAQHPVDSGDTTSVEEESSDRSILQRWPLSNIFRKRQDAGATELDWTTTDLYKNILDDGQPDDIQTFCNIWLGIPPATEVVDVTPTLYASIRAYQQVY
jgi:hypothetical protein